MLTTTFDTHAAVKQLRAAGVGDTQAETLVDIIRRSIGDAVTRADIEPLATKEFVRAEIAGVHAKIAGVRTEMARIEARLFRHLWVMAIGIVGATFTLLKLFP